MWRSPTRWFGDGPVDLVYAPHLTNLWSLWQSPLIQPFLSRLADQVRLIVFNPRGTGLSDRPRNVTLEARMDDISGVLDALELERAPLFGVAESANVCALFAATYPERCERLVLFAPYARSVRFESYPYGATKEDWLDYVRDVRDRWGDREFLEDFARLINPGMADPDWFVWMHRLSVSPGAAADFARMQLETDVTDVLGSIRVPTLVLYRSRTRESARYVVLSAPPSSETRVGASSSSSIRPRSDVRSRATAGSRLTLRAMGSSAASTVPPGRSRVRGELSEMLASSTSRSARASTQESAR